MTYLDKDYMKGLDALQAWSYDIGEIVNKFLADGDAEEFKTSLARLSPNILVELYRTSGLLHASALALSALHGPDASKEDLLPMLVSSIDGLAGMLSTVIDKIDEEKGGSEQ